MIKHRMKGVESLEEHLFWVGQGFTGFGAFEEVRRRFGKASFKIDIWWRAYGSRRKRVDKFVFLLRHFIKLWWHFWWIKESNRLNDSLNSFFKKRIREHYLQSILVNFRTSTKQLSLLQIEWKFRHTSTASVVIRLVKDATL